jgi:hypothetical protein
LAPLFYNLAFFSRGLLMVRGAGQFEDFQKEIFSSLPFPAGTANKSKKTGAIF